MKLISLMITSIVVFSSSAFASTNATSIYATLNVEEQALPASRIQLKFEKSIGGLACVKTNDIRTGDSFVCSLTLSKIDAGAIYAALDVEEEALPSNRMVLKLKKSVGNLSCVKSSHVLNGDSFDCAFAL